MTQKKLIAGNWKMNGLIADSVARTDALLTSMAQGGSMESFEMLICPPMSVLGQVTTMTKDSPLACGGQDCHFEKTGAHTGDISAEMLKDQGCDYVIVGHSANGILDYAEKNEIDCIIVASHRPGYQDYFLGSTAARVVRHATCAVHVLR